MLRQGWQAAVPFPQRRWPWGRVFVVGQSGARPGGDRRPPSFPELGPAAPRAPPACGGSWQPRWGFEGGCTAAGRGSPLPNALFAGRCGPGRAPAPVLPAGLLPGHRSLLRLCKRLCLPVEWYQSTVKDILGFAVSEKNTLKIPFLGRGHETVSSNLRILAGYTLS